MRNSFKNNPRPRPRSPLPARPRSPRPRLLPRPWPPHHALQIVR